MGDGWDVSIRFLAAIVFAAFVSFAWTSRREGERRAARISLAIGVVVGGALAALSLAPAVVEIVALAAVAVLVGVGYMLFDRPIGRIDAGPRVPEARPDERDIMFSRGILQPGTPPYEDFYARRPEKKESDDRTRSLPGLLSPDSAFSNPLPFHAAGASFGFIETVAGGLDGPHEETAVRADPAGITSFITALARYYGAHGAGVAALQPHHFYSHHGQPLDRYGEPVTPEHTFAVAFAMEMDFAMVAGAPEAPIVMESARNYAEGAKIALELSFFIRSLGYAARAQIVDNYDVLATLVARDAGLGEIGRHGLLISPRLGTRVRLGLVTTDLPLVPHTWRSDASVIDFCAVCRKCADNCPSNSIPKDDRRMIDGALRWQIDSETCYRYWCSAGTDCGVCMRVCPYSHPDTAWHNVVRWANRRSGAARRAALHLDDVFYGRRPAARPGPRWVPERPRKG